MSFKLVEQKPSTHNPSYQYPVYCDVDWISRIASNSERRRCTDEGDTAGVGWKCHETGTREGTILTSIPLAPLIGTLFLICGDNGPFWAPCLRTLENDTIDQPYWEILSVYLHQIPGTAGKNLAPALHEILPKVPRPNGRLPSLQNS